MIRLLILVLLAFFGWNLIKALMKATKKEEKVHTVYDELDEAKTDLEIANVKKKVAETRKQAADIEAGNTPSDKDK